VDRTKDLIKSGGEWIRWQLPDGVEFLDEIPKTSVGTFSKKELRDRFARGAVRS
jgi:fatty-acyl-CoA synthase